MAVVKSRDEWPVFKTKGKGPLVRVELAPGRFVKMYQKDAEAKGLAFEPEVKSRTAMGDKMIRGPSREKGRQENQLRAMKKRGEIVGLEVDGLEEETEEDE